MQIQRSDEITPPWNNYPIPCSKLKVLDVFYPCSNSKAKRKGNSFYSNLPTYTNFIVKKVNAKSIVVIDTSTKSEYSMSKETFDGGELPVYLLTQEQLTFFNLHGTTI